MKVNVYMQTFAAKKPARVGTLSQGVGGVDFEYSKKWLASEGYAISPLLGISKKKAPAKFQNIDLSIFDNTEEDSWNKRLMEAYAEIMQDKLAMPIKKYTQLDYLLAGGDTRVGALRFKSGKKFTSTDAIPTFNLSTGLKPTWHGLNFVSDLSFPNFGEIDKKLKIYLKNIIKAIADVEDKSVAMHKKEYSFRVLIDASKGLGGVRPKVHIAGKDGSMWIAKFPSKNDKLPMPSKSYDLEIWECFANHLASYLRLNVANARKVEIGKTTIFLSKRFDVEGGKQLHFIPAKSLFGNKYKYEHSNGYLEVAEFIKAKGNTADLKELWKRMIFNICIGNGDDSLYNFGFLYKNGIWNLSPFYDLNPATQEKPKLSLEEAKKLAGYFEVGKTEGEAYLDDLRNKSRSIFSLYSAKCRLQYGIENSFFSGNLNTLFHQKNSTKL